MYLHPNNGLVPNNHLRSVLQLRHRLTLFHMKPNKKSDPLEFLSAAAACIYSFSHCTLVPIVWCIVLCHLNALQCIGIWWECCVSSGDYWLPWNYLMELFISLDILYRRIGERGEKGGGGGRWYWYFRWTHNGSEQSKHMTLFFSHRTLEPVIIIWFVIVRLCLHTNWGCMSTVELSWDLEMWGGWGREGGI